MREWWVLIRSVVTLAPRQGFNDTLEMSGLSMLRGIVLYGEDRECGYLYYLQRVLFRGFSKLVPLVVDAG